RHTRSKRDWSSDVCSSDLSDCTIFAENYPPTADPVIFPLALVRDSGNLSHRVSMTFYRLPSRGSRTIARLHDPARQSCQPVSLKIGRASCRESGETRVEGG